MRSLTRPASWPNFEFLNWRAVVGLLSSVLLSGIALPACTPRVANEVEDGAIWRTSTAPIDTSGLIWASGSDVHFADGSTLDVGSDIAAMVVAGDGVFFVPDVGDEDKIRGLDLWFASPEVAAQDTGIDVDYSGLAASPDGTHLAVLATGYDNGAAEMRIYDLATGEETVSRDGFELELSDDAVDLFFESEVRIMGITNDEVLAKTFDGVTAYDLATGTGQSRPDDEQRPDADVSPDGQWRIDSRAEYDDVLVSPAGTRVRPDVDAPRATLWRWLDERTVLGTAIAGPVRGTRLDESNTLTLITCQVPSGDCEEVPGTEGADFRVPLIP